LYRAIHDISKAGSQVQQSNFVLVSLSSVVMLFSLLFLLLAILRKDRRDYMRHDLIEGLFRCSAGNFVLRGAEIRFRLISTKRLGEGAHLFLINQGSMVSVAHL
jgi:hypothetical protein